VTNSRFEPLDSYFGKLSAYQGLAELGMLTCLAIPS
jgi:hypothetical protein